MWTIFTNFFKKFSFLFISFFRFLFLFFFSSYSFLYLFLFSPYFLCTWKETVGLRQLMTFVSCKWGSWHSPNLGEILHIVTFLDVNRQEKANGTHGGYKWLLIKEKVSLSSAGSSKHIPIATWNNISYFFGAVTNQLQVNRHE